MKKTTLFLAVAALGGSLLAMASRDSLRKEAPEQRTVSAMGFLIDDETRPVGWYSFPVTDATSPTMISETQAVSAGAMADRTYYAQTYKSGPLPVAWNSLDISTGQLTKLADLAEDSPLYVDMTYDYSEGNLLAISHYGANSTSLRMVNPADGSSEIYADVPGLWLMTLACSYEGDIYSVANDGYFYAFNKQTKEFSQVGKSDSGIRYMQSMEFDHSTGILYWAESTSYGGYFNTLDPQTGRMTFITNLGSDGEMTGLYIPFKLAEDDAPAAVTGVTISDPAHNGSATVSMTLPSKTAVGNDLGAISSVVIESDGEVVTTSTGSELIAGAQVSILVTLPMGYHTFKVYAVNEAGNGVPRSLRAFIGEDIPAAPANIVVEADGLQAAISWDPVTVGAQGGYIDPAVTYDVVRQPGDVKVAEGIPTPACTDQVDAMGVYTYNVFAVTSKGRSAAGIADPVVIGTDVPLPYTCDFEDVNELLLWTLLDGNGDNATWERGATMDGKRTMMMRGNYTRTVDDYLITPPVRLEAGKAYKVVYDAGVMNANYPAHYTVTIGKQPTVEGQQTVVKEFTTDLRMLNRNYVYLPEIEETGTYYIGFHAQWEPGLPTLYVSNVTIEENTASWLSGVVTDGTNPLSGATVDFGEEGRSALTGEDGSFEFIEIVPGTYAWSVSKFGFETASGTYDFAPLEHKEVEIKLTPIPTATLSGRVVNAEGRGLENATVSVHGYDALSAVTDRDGYFTVAGVYLRGGYTVDVHAINYESATREIASLDGDLDLGTFTLQVKLIAPGNVAAEVSRENAKVSWDAPQDAVVEFRYDDGTDNYVHNMEMSATSRYSVVGVIYDTPAVFTSMSWNVWNSSNNGQPVDVVVFDLDENGQPTNRILYEEDGLESENYNWHECVFRYPVVAPRGALFTLRGDARLCMDNGGDDPAWPRMPEKMVMTKDYRTEPFTSRYADDNSYIFRGNLTLRAAGLPYGAPRANVAAAEAPSVEYDVWRFLEGEENAVDNWVKLNSAPVAETSFDDPSWSTAAKGMWRFAVKTVYTDGNVSYPSFSPAVPRLFTSDVTVTLLSNAPGEDASEAVVLLAGKDNTHSYSATADADGKVLFENVWEGEYVMTATKKGFQTLSEEVTVSGDADADLSFTMTESTKMPFNLMVEEPGDPASRLLRWNVLTDLFEDFEGHDDWAINSPGELGWSYIDGDGDETYYSPNYEFPNCGEPMAFIVMNPGNADPVMTDDFIDTHSGEKVLVAMSSRFGNDNDDYIISPLLEMSDEFVVSFWTRGYWWTYTETLMVGYSTDGKDAADFTWVGDPITVDYHEWNQIVTTIPAEAKYVAIRCTSGGRNYLVAIDDIYIGSPDNIPGLNADNAPARVAGTTLGYDVYLNGEKVASTNETSHLFENLPNGSHTAGVTARYASGETAMATVSFDITQSGIESAETVDVIAVRALSGAIEVAGVSNSSTVNVYRPDGVLIASAVAPDGKTIVPVAPGFYLVTVGRTTVSLLVP